MPVIVATEWDYINHLKSSTTERGQSPNEKTSYVYNNSRNRVRKVVECYSPETNTFVKSNETIFLDNIEILIKYDKQERCPLQCDALHVNTGAQGSVIVESWSGLSWQSKRITKTNRRFSYE
ncbi:uncharacterized protein TRIVIDRAFT_224391 [Trichoderma virens Gv29-8]|uniref:Uncharacterized protein n=1 Tax=Hypocrea virens (strain Gv29-8 / FGSC 10586) TaxID=413071 RepID=G9N019_HYPVG|nr:uncharacterized protein TRIVIDRAFT_224391 [Trichoderma virens Gv29-8]EHK20223.1 hypothetical protein TRIVIDRAFT_224391 [Trichoderma virens Gv29-8]UKZ45837.1 hypothetical protein TrVGV298_000030 [Trichoderma virens]UKZ72396.1 hypothetical protein TrVFT333_000025 [Trichoderma virens FT-333]